MMDKLATLPHLVQMPDRPESVVALKALYQDAAGVALVVNKWFSLQASAEIPDVLPRVTALLKHPDLTLKNPNWLRALVSVFEMNASGFHDASGAGYELMSSMVLAEGELNPQAASKLALCFPY